MKSSKKRKLNKADTVEQILSRGTVDTVERTHLTRALLGGKKLRIKLGIDPTAPDLHLGHAVVLRKLKEFQDAGHKVVLIIGDFTGMIGDPSGHSKERKPLTKKEVTLNMKKYLKQVGKIIDIKKVEVRYNSEWLSKNVSSILELMRAGTVSQVMKRDDFRERVDKGLTLLETMYPLFQGFDSVKIKADVELGGTDQLLNLLMGRHVQRHFNMKEQDILTVPLLIGTDGTKKMSKSEGNYIALNDLPKNIFGKVMSIKDDLIEDYFILCTDVPDAEIQQMKSDMKSKELNPRDVKMRLAWEITALYYEKDEADKAAQEFISVFRKKELPKHIPTLTVVGRQMELVDAIINVGAASSRSEARRLVEQGAIRVDGRQVIDPVAEISITKTGTIFRVGKKTFFKIKSK